MGGLSIYISFSASLTLAVWVFSMCYIFGHIIIISHSDNFVEAKSLSEFENIEIEKQLKIINNPAVKIIKTIDGEQYGGVDFFKQPAFDHPSMKNHKYHYKMRMRERETNSSDNVFGYLWENGMGCPFGTVPIQRVTRDDLLRINSFENKHKPRGSWNTTTYDPNNVVHPDQLHYAVGRTTNEGVKYNGATVDLCVTAPTVKPTQYSSARIHIQMGDGFIQAGLTVNPVLYKDHSPRTFVYTKASGKSCYNSHCDVGIIMVRQDFPLGMKMKQVSVRAAALNYFEAFGLIKDQANGNWWLELVESATEIGFWPSQRFRQSSGNSVEWGGEVYCANLPCPEMGFGAFLMLDMQFDAYMKRISILDGNYKFDRQVQQIEEFSDYKRQYDGYEVRVSLESSPSFGRLVLFGGPGNT